MKVATIFSGGFAGAEWALKYANIPHKIVFACEIDKFARKLYKANHECETFYEDVTKLDATPYKDKIDLLIGGFPCQAFSVAGLRRGFDDTRGTMFYELARLIDEVQPRYFIAENVKGLLSHDYGRTYKIICERLRGLGYHIACKVLNSKDYGTPQNRERIFIVGFKNVEEYHAFEFPNPIKLEKCLTDVLEDEVDIKYFLSDRILRGFKEHKKRHKKRGNGFKLEPKNRDSIATCLQTKYGTRNTDTYLNQIGNIDQKGHNSLWGRVYDTEGLGTTLNAQGGGAGAKTGLYVVPRGKNRGGYKKTSIAPTINTSSFETNNFIEDKQYHIRRLTPRECFRLMGDTQDRVNFANLSDTQLYRNAGNGMEIQVLKAIIGRMINDTTNK